MFSKILSFILILTIAVPTVAFADTVTNADGSVTESSKTTNADGSVTYSDKWDFSNDRMTIDGVELYAKWEKRTGLELTVNYVDKNTNAVLETSTTLHTFGDVITAESLKKEDKTNERKNKKT